MQLSKRIHVAIGNYFSQHTERSPEEIARHAVKAQVFTDGLEECANPIAAQLAAVKNLQDLEERLTAITKLQRGNVEQFLRDFENACAGVSSDQEPLIQIIHNQLLRLLSIAEEFTTLSLT